MRKLRQKQFHVSFRFLTRGCRQDFGAITQLARLLCVPLNNYGFRSTVSKHFSTTTTKIRRKKNVFSKSLNNNRLTKISIKKDFFFQSLDKLIRLKCPEKKLETPDSAKVKWSVGVDVVIANVATIRFVYWPKMQKNLLLLLLIVEPRLNFIESRKKAETIYSLL